jgi:hypothetical protein
MKATITAVAVAAILAAATIAAPAAGLDDGFVTNALVGKPAPDAQPASSSTSETGYIAYSEYGASLPAPGCYWTRMPIYDAKHNVIGWRGRPLAVCP